MYLPGSLQTPFTMQVILPRRSPPSPPKRTNMDERGEEVVDAVQGGVDGEEEAD